MSDQEGCYLFFFFLNKKKREKSFSVIMFFFFFSIFFCFFVVDLIFFFFFSFFFFLFLFFCYAFYGKTCERNIPYEYKSNGRMTFKKNLVPIHFKICDLSFPGAIIALLFFVHVIIIRFFTLENLFNYFF